MTEPELIKGCIQKDQHCQRLLFEKHAGKMMSLCLRYANDEQEAQDILQDGFIKVFNYIYQFKSEGSFEGWLRKIFVNTALRHKSKQKLNFTDIDIIDNDRDFADDPFIAKISENEIHQLIRQLPDGYRTIFNLNIIEGYSHEDIAKLLHIQSSTSRSQLLKARKMLQSLILKHYKPIAQ